MSNPPTYIELPAADIALSRAFYADIFGWIFTDFGPTYASTTEGGLEVGLQADETEVTAAPLPIIEVENLDATFQAVQTAGSRIVKPIFSFPGGRRFHFLDPAGNELAAWKRE